MDVINVLSKLNRLIDSNTRKDLQTLTNIANKNIVKRNYIKAFELFHATLQAMKAQENGPDAMIVWELKLSMANTLSVVDIKMARKSRPMIYSNMRGANPIWLYDECLPQLIQALGSKDPQVQEGRIKYNLLKSLIRDRGFRESRSVNLGKLYCSPN